MIIMKRWMGLFLCFAILLSFTVQTTAFADGEEYIFNLALGKNVTTGESDYAAYPARYAVDGDMTTRWHSRTQVGHSIYVDLGKESTVHAVELYTDSSIYEVYTISGDAVQENAWIKQENLTKTETSSETAPKYYTKYQFAEPVSARFVKVVCTETSGDAKVARMYEFQVMGTVTPSAEMQADIDAVTARINEQTADGAEQNLTFPDAGDNGSVITWSTSNEVLISPEGVVTRPKNEDTTVSVFASFLLDGVRFEKKFDVVVKAVKAPTISSAGFGGKVDSDSAQPGISGLLLGVSMTELLASLEFTYDGTTAALVDETGAEVQEDVLSDLLLNYETVPKYRIKTALTGEEPMFYLLGLAEGIENHFNDTEEGTVYDFTDWAIGSQCLRAFLPQGSTSEAISVEIAKKADGDLYPELIVKDPEAITGNLLQYYNQGIELQAGDVFSISASVRPSAELDIDFLGRFNGTSGEFLPEILQFDAAEQKIHVCGEEIGNYIPDTWYNIAYTIELALEESEDPESTGSQFAANCSVWINGVQVLQDAALTLRDPDGEKNSIYPMVRVTFAADGNTSGAVAFDNILARKVADINTNGQDEYINYDGGMKIYDRSGAEAETLTPGAEYRFISNVINGSEYGYMPFFAVYQSTYLDDEANTLDSRVLVDVFSPVQDKNNYNAGNFSASYTVLEDAVTYYEGSGRLKSTLTVSAMLFDCRLSPMRQKQDWNVSGNQ